MRAIHIAARAIRQIIKDKRTLGLLFIAPLFILFLLDSVLSSSVGQPEIEAVGVPGALVTALQEEASVTEAADEAPAMEDLKGLKTDAVLTWDGKALTVYLEGSQDSITAAVKKAVASALTNFIKEHAQAQGPAASVVETNFEYLNGSENMNTFESIAPLLLGFFIFFFVFLIAGISFLRERTSGTLDRMLATPVRRFEIVLGYFLGFGLFALIQTALIQLFLVYCLGISFKGSFLLVLLINILLASGSLSLGTLLSAFARNEFQMFQFIPIVIVPQVLFCGLFSLRGAAAWVVVLSKIFPLTYASDAITNVALRGNGIESIGADLCILAGYTVAFLSLNAAALRKYRSI